MARQQQSDVFRFVGLPLTDRTIAYESVRGSLTRPNQASTTKEVVVSARSTERNRHNLEQEGFSTITRSLQDTNSQSRFLPLTEIAQTPASRTRSSGTDSSLKRKRQPAPIATSACSKRVRGMCYHKTYLFSLCGHSVTAGERIPHHTPPCASTGLEVRTHNLDLALSQQSSPTRAVSSLPSAMEFAALADIDGKQDRRISAAEIMEEFRQSVSGHTLLKSNKHEQPLKLLTKCSVQNRHPIRTYSIPYLCVPCRHAAARRVAHFETKVIVLNLDAYGTSPVVEVRTGPTVPRDDLPDTPVSAITKRKRESARSRNIANRAPQPGRPIPLKLGSATVPIPLETHEVAIEEAPEVIADDDASTGVLALHVPTRPHSRTSSTSTTSNVSWWSRITGGSTTQPAILPMTNPIPVSGPFLTADNAQPESKLPISKGYSRFVLPESPMNPAKFTWPTVASPSKPEVNTVSKDSLGRNVRGMNKIMGWSTSAGSVSQSVIEDNGIDELSKEGIVVKEIV